jgi:hypothetical protein
MKQLGNTVRDFGAARVVCTFQSVPMSIPGPFPPLVKEIRFRRSDNHRNPPSSVLQEVYFIPAR